MKRLPVLALLIVFFISCSKKPEPINYGKDACEHCKMTIMDTKYGAEIVTAKGKIFKFDAAECMVDFLKDDPKRLSNPEDLFLTVSIAHPGTLIDARSAFFLIDKAFRSPMGANLASFESRQTAENNLQSPDGRILTWDELLKTR